MALHTKDWMQLVPMIKDVLICLFKLIFSKNYRDNAKSRWQTIRPGRNVEEMKNLCLERDIQAVKFSSYYHGVIKGMKIKKEAKK